MSVHRRRLWRTIIFVFVFVFVFAQDNISVSCEHGHEHEHEHIHVHRFPPWMEGGEIAKYEAIATSSATDLLIY